jgi:cobaltochelatase CobS
LVRFLASQTQNAFVRVNHNGGSTVEDILGRWTIQNGNTVWVDGLLITAMKKGYWFHADEINAAGPEITFAYHSLLDDDARVILVEKGDEVIIPHENFRFFAAMNPPTEYAGTKELNKALMSRFIVCKTDFPAPDVEADILVTRTGIPKDVAEKMVQTAGEARVMHSKEEIRYVFSTRDLIMWGVMYRAYRKYIASAEMTVLNKIGADDYEVIRDMFGLKFKDLDEKPAKKATETV